MMKKIVALVLVLMIGNACILPPPKQKPISLDSAWKFINKDSLAFASPDFDDSGWNKIKVNTTWDKQGYPQSLRFAWYRIKVVIPSSLKKQAALQDSLIFHLGKIDDFDQVFLNGALIGENTRSVPPHTIADNTFKDSNVSYWDVERRYALAVDDPRIRWDQANLLAVRVYNWNGPGGIFSGDLTLSMADISEYVRVNVRRNQFTFGNGQARKDIEIKNTAEAYPLDGLFTVKVENNLDTTLILEKKWAFHLKPKEKRILTFTFPRPKQSTSIWYKATFRNSRRSLYQYEGVPYLLTPPEKLQPQINGARVYGQRVDKPFLFRIPASGKRPMNFSATGLPQGLKLDAQTGIISGVAHKRGSYDVVISARNALGEDRQTLRILIGERIVLTPPMGWNSWNVWGLSVTQSRVYAAAKAFVDKGLVNHGWMYINIDDGWEIYGKSEEPKRKSNGEIRTNKKFPDMKQLSDAVHALGLKTGIYSSPGPLTCGGYTASYQHEAQDARTFANWGIDYLKYDLCSYRKLMNDQNNPLELLPPYQKMYKALQTVNRDIAYSICEYGLGKVWEWGAKAGGNLWRTTGDIWDDWERMASIGFKNEQAAPYAGPGGWNDPDMLVVGWLGWGDNLHYTNLTPDEQYTHVSLWALLSAPLLLGCDLTRLDDFTLNLIINDEVIAIDQDALGMQAVPVIKNKTIQVWKKKLADGALAVGIFNIGSQTTAYALDLSKLGLSRQMRVRDVWRQTDMGTVTNTFNTILPAHGVTLIKLISAGQ